ncbi:hypothetical protein [Streptomyces sp. ok210]|uniref:hypothetical protein n=1 Tax=Streptomyces sp. ok210 TaxID=1761905 RepID=UPI001160A082|nr:hypothetical protein [Streptomyces sp. ok210]
MCAAAVWAERRPRIAKHAVVPTAAGWLRLLSQRSGAGSARCWQGHNRWAADLAVKDLDVAPAAPDPAGIA